MVNPELFEVEYEQLADFSTDKDCGLTALSTELSSVGSAINQQSLSADE